VRDGRIRTDRRDAIPVDEHGAVHDGRRRDRPDAGRADPQHVRA
jgi:hypothetical protein